MTTNTPVPTITVGRIVHIGVDPVAALVTKANADGSASLRLFFPDGTTEHQENIPFSSAPSDFAWSFPPRV